MKGLQTLLKKLLWRGARNSRHPPVTRYDAEAEHENKGPLIHEFGR
jgi:hypothetical protein